MPRKLKNVRSQQKSGASMCNYYSVQTGGVHLVFEHTDAASVFN
jgi:hypothetical protein